MKKSLVIVVVLLLVSIFAIVYTQLSPNLSLSPDKYEKDEGDSQLSERSTGSFVVSQKISQESLSLENNDLRPDLENNEMPAGIIVQLLSEPVVNYYASFSDDKEADPEQIQQYRQTLIQEHEEFKSRFPAFEPTKEYFTAFNGFAFRTEDQDLINNLIVEISSESSNYKIWPLRKIETTLVQSVPLIGATVFWNSTGGNQGQGVSVAVLDTGVDYTHPAFGSCSSFTNCPKFRGGYDFVNNDNNPMDDNGHGTHVASTVAGVAGTSSLNGVAPAASLGAVKICTGGGSCFEDDVLDGIDYAIDPNGDLSFNDKYDIISMSIGGSGTPDEPMAQAVDNANNVGSLVVVAAGNNGISIQCPGCARKAFTVGATTKQDTMAYFSGKGPVIYNDEHLSKPDVTAPGFDICAARWGNAYSSYNTNCNNDGIHVAISGTSMATPHVSGAAALIKSQNPTWGLDKIKSALTQTSVDIGQNIYVQGSGRIDLRNILNLKALIVPSKIELGLLNATSSLVNFSFYIDKLGPEYLYLYIGNISVKNIQTGQSYDLPKNPWHISMFSTQGYQFSSPVNISDLPLGTYSGIMDVMVYNYSNISQLIHILRVPVGFSKLNKLNVKFIGTPPSPTGTYYYHYNDMLILPDVLTGYEMAKLNYEYGPNHQYNYRIYTHLTNFDFLARMIEMYPSTPPNKINVNYFLRRINVSQVQNIVFNENQAQHIQHNWNTLAGSMGHEYITIHTTLEKYNMVTNTQEVGNLFFFFTFLVNSPTIELGISNVGQLAHTNYLISMILQSKNTLAPLNITPQRMILPSSFYYPFTNITSIITPQQLKSTNITIPSSFVSNYNNIVYLFLGTYTRSYTYGYSSLGSLVTLPRALTFYYLEGCPYCNYHFMSYLYNGPSSGQNALIWQEYYNGKAKSHIESIGMPVPPAISFYKNPELKINTKYCYNHYGTSYYCNDKVLYGQITDEFDGGAKYATEFISGNLKITSPNGQITNVFTNDTNNLYFGGWGSFMIDCSSPPSQPSQPNILNNPSLFCQNGDYIFDWEVPNVFQGQTLRKKWAVNYNSNRGFSIIG